MINITFPDGAVREYQAGVTTFEIAESISKSLAKKALAGKFNGKLIDTTRAIEEEGTLEIVTPDHEDALDILRHSAAHWFAQAARRVFPEIKLGVGAAIYMSEYASNQKVIKFIRFGSETLASIPSIVFGLLNK